MTYGSLINGTQLMEQSMLNTEYALRLNLKPSRRCDYILVSNDLQVWPQDANLIGIIVGSHSTASQVLESYKNKPVWEVAKEEFPAIKATAQKKGCIGICNSIEQGKYFS
jgi:hypothetical protein